MRITSAILIVVGVFQLACSRTPDSVSVTVHTPNRSAFQSSNPTQASEAIPGNKKICFGINVTGSGIATNSVGSCGGASVGIFSGFVGENSDLTVAVTKGNRNFELVVLLVAPGTDCPGFAATPDLLAKMVSSGHSDNVSVANDAQTVDITLNYAGAAANFAVAGCGPAQLRGSLNSAGDIETSSGTELSQSHPFNVAFFMTEIADDLAVGFLTAFSVLNFGTLDLDVPPYVYSMTRKPDTGEYFGLLNDNSIVKLERTSTGFKPTLLDSTTCPFLVADCQAPPWFQSISAGLGVELFGLDHGGGIYRTTETSVQFLESINSNITQVTYY